MDLIQINNELGLQLIQEGLVSSEILKEILNECNAQGKHLGSTLLKKNIVSANRLAETLQKLEAGKSNSQRQPKEVAPFRFDVFPDVQSRIGNYEILEKIAKGGMGVVYKAQDRENGRLVALKVLLGGSFASASHVHRFLREAQAMSRLQHPNIIPVYGMGKQEGLLYLAMKYIPGKTFEKSLSENEPLEQKIKILILIGQALSYAHKNNILHRDIKPSNILIDQDGTPYLADFGLAKMLDSNSKVTQSGTTVGTPYYMSPEHTQDVKRMDFRSDIYSMGVVLYQTLSGKLPFFSDNVSRLFFLIHEKEAKIPEDADKSIPPRLWDVCFKAMQKLPKYRYANAFEMALDMERALKNKPLLKSRFSFFFYKGLRKAKRSVVVLLPIMAVLAILGGFFHFFYSSPRVPDIPSLWEKAKKTFDEQKDEQSLQYVDHILKQKPDFKEALLLQASIFERQKKGEMLRLSWRYLSEFSLAPEEFDSIGKKALKLGYLEDAVRCFQRAIHCHPLRQNFHKPLAKALLALGESKKALASYEKLREGKDPEAFLGMARAYLYEKRYEDSSLSLRNLKLGSGPSFQQATFLFLQAVLEWQECSHSLNQEEWLSQKKKHLTVSDLPNRIGNIARSLESAQKILDRCPPEDHAETLFQQEVRAHLHAIRLEQEISPEIVSMLAPPLSLALPENRRIFLQKARMRGMIRNGLYAKAADECGLILQEHPLECDLYAIRAVAAFHAGAIGLAIRETLNSFEKDPSNFIPLGNLFSLLLERPDQENLQLIWDILISFTTKFDTSLEKVVLETRMARSIEFFLKEGHEQEVPPKSIEFQFLMDSFLRNPSPKVRQVALEMLSAQHQNEALVQRIEALKRERLDARQRADLDTLENALLARRTKELLRKLTVLLMKYELSPLPEYLSQISGLEGSETFLVNMLESPDESPMVRFLAAQMLCRMNSLDAFRRLSSIADSDRYPENLLAFCALRKNNFQTPPGKPLEKKISNMTAKEIHTYPELYQLLLFLYFFPRCPRETIDHEATDPSSFTSLCVVYQSYREEDTNSFQRVEHFQNHKDPEIRSLALRLFWNDKTFEMRGAKKKCLAFYARHWQNCGNSLLDAIRQENSRTVRFSGIFLLAFSEYLPLYLTDPQSAGNPYLPEIQKKLLELTQDPRSDNHIRFWSMMALGKLNANEVWKFLKDPNMDFFVRVASLYGMFHAGAASEHREKMLTMPKIMHTLSLLREYASTRPMSLDDRKFQQVTLYILSRFDFMLLGVASNLRKWIEDKTADPYVRIASLACLMWQGKREDLPLLKPFLKHPETIYRHTATASFAALMMRYEKNKLGRFQRFLQKQDFEVRKAAAMGYHSPILRLCISESPGFLEDDFESGELSFDLYFRKFRKECVKPWENILEHCIALHPSLLYLFENAVLREKFYGVDRAMPHADEILSRVRGKKTPEERRYYKKTHLLKARWLSKQGKYAQALESLRTLLEAFPGDWAVHLWKSKVHELAGEMENKALHFDKALLGAPIKIRRILFMKLESRIYPWKIDDVLVSLQWDE